MRKTKSNALQLTDAEVAKINKALGKLDADLAALAVESARIDAEEKAKPVDKSDRWWKAYYRLENTFLHEVREAMAADGLSAADLARLLGVSRARVSQILNGGEENFKLETIAKLATALDRQIGLRLLRKGEELMVRSAYSLHDVACRDSLNHPVPNGKTSSYNQPVVVSARIIEMDKAA
jgi:predicted XRE-type DNA-binding protein